MRLVAFCEARADFTITSELIDRVLGECGPPWVTDNIDDAPDAVRVWRGDGNGRSFFDVQGGYDYARELQVRVPHGRFNGYGAHGGLMARTVFRIIRRLLQIDAPIDAVVLVWDMDHEPTKRLPALEDARAETASWAPFQIVIGGPNAKREAWVLAGFDPADDYERQRLLELRRELGFAPHEQSSRLHATDDQAKLSAKRVLASLVGGDWERERRCWTDTPLSSLADRGEDNGLRAFLGEIEERIVPLCEKG